MKGVWLLLAGAGSILLLLSAVLVTPVLSLGRDYDEWTESPNVWQNQGGDVTNRREALFESKISKESVTKLSLKWTALTDYDVSSTPAIDGRGRGAVYFSSWDGCQYAVTKDTGKLIWKVNLTEMAVPQFDKLVCRSTPTIAGPLLLFGIFGPCFVVALDRSTGTVVWWTKLDSHPYCVITQSGTYHQGAFYIGTSSKEEIAPAETCCTFQGAFFKLNAKTGKKVWRVSMLPNNHKKIGLYSGAAIWGSSPAIDVSRRLVYIATGNEYTTPPKISACEEGQLNKTNASLPDPCLVPGNHAESFVAINIDTGKIAWATHLGAYDTWTSVCQHSPVPLPNCPPIIGEDYDFGEAPFLVTIKEEHGSSCRLRDIVVAGQKSGIVHALDRTTGHIVWQTAAGPGGKSGGAAWGMATDGERVFTSIINDGGKNFTLVPSSAVITWGGWVSINASTGTVLWSTANPVHFGTFPPVAYANGVVFGGSTGNSSSGTPSGQIVALDSETGTILWEYRTQGGLGGGASIMDGCIFQPVGGTPSSLGRNPSPSSHGHSTISLCVP